MSREQLLDEREKIFYEILTKYYNKYGPDWNLDKIELFGTKIILKAPEHLKFPVNIKKIFKLFHQYVAGLTEEDFPNIKKIHTSPKFIFPRCYWTSEYIDKPITSDSKTSSEKSFKVNTNETINTIFSKDKISRKRKRIEKLSITKDEKTSITEDENITLAKFMRKISNDTSDDILKIRKIIKEREDEEKLEKLQKPIIDMKKHFILNLPYNVFLILHSKGGFIKPVKLNDDDYKNINNTKIIMGLYEHSLIY